jgi:leader peptidase (prepilin peptidase)/N-methyltransferase
MSELLTSIELIFLPLVVVLSLMIGSFLNVVIYRLPLMMERAWRKEAAEYLDQVLGDDEQTPMTLSVPRSACPHCQHSIRWYENIPLFSYLLILKGRCSSCAKPISLRYPFVELLTASVGGVVVYNLGFSLTAVAALLFSYALIALLFIDADHQLLPDSITLPMIWLGLLVNWAGGFVSLDAALWGAVIGYLSLWTVYWLFKLLTGKEGMGYGDFKLLAAIGAWAGIQVLPGVILISSLVGVIFAVIQSIIGKRDLQSAMPFGPFLAIAGWIMLIWGGQINSWYLSLL